MASMQQMERRLTAKIENMDKHIMIALNIIKQALKEGSLSMIKLREGQDDFLNACEILDFKPSTGRSIVKAKEVCETSPNDAITKTVEVMKEKQINGPWRSWRTSPFAR